MHTKMTILLFASLLLLPSLLAAASVKAQLRGHVIVANSSDSAISVLTRDTSWVNTTPTAITLYPQRSIRLSDRQANAALDHAKPLVAEVKVRYNSSELVVMVSWKDRSYSIALEHRVATFGDQIALSLPLNYPKNGVVPHIGMGDSKHPVALYLQKAVKQKNPFQQTYLARGFGSLTQTKKLSAYMTMNYDKSFGGWRALFKLPLTGKLKTVLNSGLFPISFALWNGKQHERGGNKRISSWHFIYRPEREVNQRLVKKLSYGLATPILGDVKEGEKLVKTNSTFCHRIGPYLSTPEGVAPNLSGIGGVALPAYLKESIVTPDAIVVRNLHLNRHYQKGGERDAHGAYPHNMRYKWYRKGKKGVLHSNMPSYQAILTPEQLNSVVLYLQQQK
ncbi:MAG: cytochrome C [Bdellovibrionales bacterium]|nr:cytochrome C [Bdellovibrionales bacterium]